MLMYSLFFWLHLLVGQRRKLPLLICPKVRAAKVQPDGPREAARQEPVRLEDKQICEACVISIHFCDC